MRRLAANGKLSRAMPPQRPPAAPAHVPGPTTTWRLALAAALGLALAGPTPIAHAVTVRDANAVAIDELLRSARLWQALEHPDAERHVLRKLLAIDAREPRALLLLGELELRVGNAPEAQRALVALRASHPGSRQVAELEALVQVYARQKGGLDELRLALRGGNLARAQALARGLFPGGRPPGDLANEFAGLIAATPAGWAAMRAQFEARIAADPTPADQLSLDELLAAHPETRAQALRGFAQLSHSHELPPERVQGAWRDALAALDRDEAGLAERQRFLARYPSDPDVRADVARIEAARIAAQQKADDPAAPARQQATQALDAGRLAEAESLLQASLQAHPDDSEALGLLGLVRLRQARDDEALQQFEAAARLAGAQGLPRQRWVDLAATARYWGTLQQARSLRAAGDLEGAAQRVIRVQQTQPEQTEAQQLLAAIRAQQGRTAEAETLYRALLARDGSDARAWRGLLSLRLAAGAVDATLDQAQDLPLAANVAMADALDGGDLRDAIARTAAAHPDTALRQLERGVRLLPRDPWLRYDLAQQYRRLQLPELARQVMHDGTRLAPEDDAMRYAAALVDAATDRDAAALAAVEAVPPERQTEGMRSLAQRLRFERDLREARAARADGRAADDPRARQAALQEAGHDVDRRLRVAGADVAADDPAAALALLQDLLQPSETLTLAQHRTLAGILIDAGDPAGALRELDARLAVTSTDTERADLLIVRARAHVAQHEPAAARADADAARALIGPDDIDRRLAAVEALDADRPAARAAMAEALARHPQDPDTLLEAARQAQRDHEYGRAVALLRQVHDPAPPADRPGPLEGPVPLLGLDPLADGATPDVAQQTDGPSQRAARALDQIEARRQPRVETAWMGFVRHADEGISTLRGTEIPVALFWPQDNDGHWFAQVDAVHLDAGTLPAAPAGSAAFGKVQALAPAGLPGPFDEKATGLSLAGGWRSDNRRWDLGIVGAGFKVPNLVGSWRENREWGATDVTAEIARRVLTGSLLSYAGATDPVSGTSWGGVTETALNLRAARDFPGRWGGSLSASLGLLAGREVPTNSDVKLRGALGREWVHRPDFRLSAGAALSLWHYGKSESFYTFGQGGYYSPQRYLSLGLPVEIEGRHGRLSYDVRATPSRSWTYEQDTPYYPGSGSLQALAGNPVHAGGNGGGVAGSLRAVLEYRANAHWAIGSWLDIDRSAYYAPTRAMIYLRYSIKPQQGPVDYPPQPVVPISLF